MREEVEGTQTHLHQAIPKAWVCADRTRNHFKSLRTMSRTIEICVTKGGLFYSKNWGEKNAGRVHRSFRLVEGDTYTILFAYQGRGVKYFRFVDHQVLTAEEVGVYAKQLKGIGKFRISVKNCQFKENGKNLEVVDVTEPRVYAYNSAPKEQGPLRLL